MSRPFVFFTMNDFRKEGGGTIRMLGILNELAEEGKDITLVSNLEYSTKVHSNIKTVPIDYAFPHRDKRKLQFLTGAFSYKTVNRQFPALLQRLNEVFSAFPKDSRFIFFEYLDNSIAYWLKMNGVIPEYFNDVHGIASNEFDFQAARTPSPFKKLFLNFKKWIGNRLDKKVFENADGIIYASRAMEDYFFKLYPVLREKESILLPYLISGKNIPQADPVLVDEFRNKLEIAATDFVFLFAGAFKETGGVQDLITAFKKIYPFFPHAKLLLIGDGPSMVECRKTADDFDGKENILFLGRQPYGHLASYQEISHVLVCPDRQNLFSDLIVHVKYLDALVSGKLVINGSFKSVLEINEEKKLSLLFEPSDVNDLSGKMKEAIENYNELLLKFKDSKDYTLNNLTYRKFIQNLS